MKDKKIIDLNKRRKKLNFKKLLRALRIPIGVFAVIIAIFLSARLVGKVATSNITDSIRQIGTVFSDGKGYPYSLKSLNARKTDAIGDRLMIISSDESLVLDSRAGELFRYQLGNAESKVITSNGRALVYSNGSGKVILQSKTEILGTVEEPRAVVTAALAENGRFATSRLTESARSVLTVYDSKFGKEFEWECAEERITAIALSPDGKRVAVTATGVENAEIYSRVIIFNTKKYEPICDQKFSGTLFLKIFAPSKNTVIAVGDNKTVVLGKNGEKVDELTYAENSISLVESDDKGHVAVCRSEFGGAKSSVTVFKKNGARAGEISIHGDSASIDIGSNKIVTVVGDEIIVYNFKGEEKDRFRTESSPSQVIFCDGGVYAVENGFIRKY